MRYRLMAMYRGAAYEAGVGPTDRDVTLFAALPPPEELGFQPATGHWRKAVSRAEVDAVWESRPSGVFGGEPCLVLDDLGEHLHISYLGHDLARAGRLGYSEMEPGVFELLADREDVTDITEDRVDHAFLPWQEGWPGSDAADAADGHLATTAPTPAVGYPEPESDPAVMYQGPVRDRAAEHPGPRPDPAAAYPGPVPDPAAMYPGPVPDPAISHPEPRPDPANTHPDPRPDPTITHRGPVPDPAISHPEPRPDPAITGPDPGAELDKRQRRAARRPPRAQIRQVFAELARLAALPPDSYAVDEAVDGAMCLVSTDTGFEVFSASDGVKREARLFNDEEAAYFYLFGLLAAEAVRDGRLVPPWAARASAHLNNYGE
ncbi:MAG TPA: hypothetical protein VGI37_07305 [Streptosporangiaceae bacterium]